MRAVYLKEINNEDKTVKLSGSQNTHLVKVSRTKVGDEVLVLNGKGLILYTNVANIEKNHTELDILKSETISDERWISLLVGVPKKDALEEVLKKSSELGIKKIILYESEYSQKFNLKEERINSLLESGYIQSNNPWDVEIIGPIKKDELEKNLDYFPNKFVMSVEPGSVDNVNKEESLLMIGPEAGFSKEEEIFFEGLGSKSINLNTPILRTPTAVVAAVGFLHGAVKI
ncbi:MAG: 16S rRNA (uracil(1498)-N(3))-methyltransferase [Bacteriovoracaceae bacterium]|nr:16S rRNA (uracil(1498)-N(3))-methyltransferase [Bacteriovoracaceae bacterium]